MLSSNRFLALSFLLTLSLGMGCSDASPDVVGGIPTDAGFGGGDAGTSPSFPVDAGDWTGTPDPEESACTTNGDCPAEPPYCSPSELCFECGPGFPCPEGTICQTGLCLAQSCTPGQQVCNGDRLLTCNTSGTGWDIFECPGEAGWCENGACIGCEPGYSACVGKSERAICAADGAGVVTEACPEDNFCVEGECRECYPGTKQCVGDWVQACGTDGIWAYEEDCAASGGTCGGGICQSPCGMTGKLSNEGCDYWAVDMDNEGSAADSPYAVIGSNLNSYAVSISVTAKQYTGAIAGPTDAPAPVAAAA